MSGVQDNSCYYSPLEKKTPKKRHPKIVLESAYSIPYYEFIDKSLRLYEFQVLKKQLLDIFDERIKEMDKYNIRISIISLRVPGIESLDNDDYRKASEYANIINTTIYKISYPYRHRIKLFAVLPMLEPNIAARELERCVKEFNFVGALVNGSTSYYINGKRYENFYTDKKYDILWKKFIELNVPIYFHPKELKDSLLFKEDERYNNILAGSPWGFSVTVEVLILKLLMSGIYDRNPTLKIILGHQGEFLPMELDRIDHRLCVYKSYIKNNGKLLNSLPSEETKTYLENLKKFPKHNLKYYFDKYIYLTTSGFFSKKFFPFINKKKLLFSIDYPFESVKNASNWIDNCKLPLKLKQDICFKNAERLFNLSIMNSYSPLK